MRISGFLRYMGSWLNSIYLTTIRSHFKALGKRNFSFGAFEIKYLSNWWIYCPMNLLYLPPSLPPPPSPPTQMIANSHIAVTMKLMFYGPLLCYNKMTWREGRGETVASGQMKGRMKNTSFLRHCTLSIIVLIHPKWRSESEALSTCPVSCLCKKLFLWRVSRTTALTMEENVIAKLVCINTSTWIVWYPDIPPNFHGKAEFVKDCHF